MNKHLSQYLVQWLVRKGAIPKSDFSLYDYAVRSLVRGISPAIIALLLGLLLGMALESALYITPYLIIRKFSGGYHLQSPQNCLLVSVVILSSGLMVIRLMSNCENTLALSTSVIIAELILFFCSPINSKARQLNAQEKVLFRKVTRILSIISLFLYMLGARYMQPKYSASFGIGIVLVAGLQIPPMIEKCSSKIMSRKQKNKAHM